MTNKKKTLLVTLFLSMGGMIALTPLIYRKVSNHYISKKVRQQFLHQGKEIPLILSLPEMIFPLSTNSVYILKLQVGLELTPEQPDLISELTLKTTQIQQRFQDLFQDYSVAALRQVTNKNKIKEQVKQEINLQLEKGKVNNIYFEKFLIISSDS